jgi:Tfp pilus assembly protein PilO
MVFQDVITIISLIIALLGLIFNFSLQKDQKKIRDFERENKKLKSNLSKSILAIKGYQLIEEETAKNQSIDLPSYRRNIRKDKSEYFDADFLAPGNIDRIINNFQD